MGPEPGAGLRTGSGECESFAGRAAVGTAEAGGSGRPASFMTAARCCLVSSHSIRLVFLRWMPVACR